jgi:IMP dehydrogenase
MAGDVCSYEGAYRLAEAGCTSIRVGIGPGSICKTRTITGHGVPQLSAIEDCARIKEKFPEVAIIADGGIRNSGDAVKCLAIGADAVMVGGLLAGTEETPGQTLRDEEGNLYKMYSGMASEEARMSYYNKEDSLFVPEGVSVKIPFKGSAKKIVQTFVGGIKVGMSYSDARTLKELTEKAQWVRITNGGLRESVPHAKIK